MFRVLGEESSMTKDQLNTVLTALHTGRALARESAELLQYDDFLDEETKERSYDELDTDMGYLNEAIVIVTQELQKEPTT